MIFEAMAPTVIVSLPEPPRTLSTLDTVAVFAAELNVIVSSPAPRSIEPFETWVE